MIRGNSFIWKNASGCMWSPATAGCSYAATSRESVRPRPPWRIWNWRGGAEISARDFRLAIDVAAGSGAVGVSELAGRRLLGSRGRRPVVPRTPQQMVYLRAIEESDITFGLGPAGTGKTYLAMAMALSMLKRRLVSRVVLTRPAVEAGEALGFLPGDLRDKVAPYLRPLYDAIEDMLDPEEGQRFLDDGSIEIAPLAFMRGRTLSKAFLILDEAQNTTREQMFMALTRLGEGSRCVVTGDGSQVDLKPGIRSGLAEVESSLPGVAGISFVRFSAADVVRHPVVGRVIEAYERTGGARERRKQVRQNDAWRLRQGLHYRPNSRIQTLRVRGKAALTEFNPIKASGILGCFQTLATCPTGDVVGEKAPDPV